MLVSKLTVTNVEVVRTAAIVLTQAFVSVIALFIIVIIANLAKVWFWPAVVFSLIPCWSHICS